MNKTGIGPQGYAFIEYATPADTIERLRNLGIDFNGDNPHISRLTLLPLCQICWVERTDHLVSEGDDGGPIRICGSCWRYVCAVDEHIHDDLPLQELADLLAKTADKRWD